MQTYYKNNYNRKYSKKHINLFTGFLYFFGFIDNPYHDEIKRIKRRTDIEALRSDWNAVGADFEKVIEKEKPRLHACK